MSDYLQNKIDFVVLFSAEKANVNGDPSTATAPARITRATAKCPMCASRERSATGCRIWKYRYLFSLPIELKMVVRT